MWQRLRRFEGRSSPLILAAVLLLTFSVYAPTLNDWFSGDDFWFLRSAQKFSFWEYAQMSFDVRQVGDLPEFDRYRPLYPVVWRVQFALLDLNAAWYHVVVVLLHVANTALVWMLARRLIGGVWPAAAAALIFGLHPAYADAVAWLSGANRVFAMFPYLVSMLLFIRSFEELGARRVALLSGAFAAFLLAVLMHSAALTLILVLPAYLFLIARPQRSLTDPRAWAPLLPFLAVAIALFIVQGWTREHLDAERQFSFGWHQYAIYGFLLGKSLFPVDRTNDIQTDIVEGVQGIGSVILLGLALLLLIRQRPPGLGAFAVAWFFLALFPDSTLRVQDLAAGRLIYLSAAALALMLVVGASEVYRMLPATARRFAQLALLGAPLLVAGAFALTLRHTDRHSQQGERNEAFIEAVRTEVGSISEEGTLFVVNAPANIRLFNDSRIDALIELYYGDVEVRSISPEEANELESSLEPDERLYRYHPQGLEAGE